MHQSDPELLVLHALRLKGFAEPAAVADLSGLPEPDAAAVLDRLLERSLVLRREGRISGYALTPAGRAEHGERLAAEVEAAGCRPLLESGYQRFLAHNEGFKGLCTAWQTEGRPAACVDQLAALHDEVAALVDALAGGLRRYAAYRPRFERALARLRAGDHDAFTRPLSGSYHDIWMELHEDLLASLGRARSAADGS